MKRFLYLYKKVNGKEVLKQYRYAHVLFYALVMTIMLGFDKKSLEILRLAVQNKVLKKMRRKYKDIVETTKNSLGQKTTPTTMLNDKRKVWVCWLQGMENAPYLVQRCYSSLREHLRDREIILITNNNYKKYLSFPDYIEDKIKRGVISKTHMSDLIRLELLIRYGGTWIDSTVLCTADPEEFYMDSDLFVFQCMKPGLDGKSTSISNWFISSEKNNKILILTLSLLYEYWRENDKLVDYFIFHDFFQIAIEEYADDWNKVVPVSNSTPHILLLRLFDKYDEKTWNEIRKQTPFHKLAYKRSEEEFAKKGTYYDVIFNQSFL